MSNQTEKDIHSTNHTWSEHFFPLLLEMMERVPRGNTFTSAKLRKAFEDQGFKPLPGFWGYAIPALRRRWLIRKTNRFCKSSIPASRGRRLPVWEKA